MTARDSTFSVIPFPSVIPTVPGVAFGEVWSRGTCMQRFLSLPPLSSRSRGIRTPRISPSHLWISPKHIYSKLRHTLHMPYWVYILSNERRSVLYTGITGNIECRLSQHKEKKIDGFTKKYNVKHLLFIEEFQGVRDAIASEKRIKGWSRFKKWNLIRARNPKGEDLLRENTP